MAPSHLVKQYKISADKRWFLNNLKYIINKSRSLSRIPFFCNMTLCHGLIRPRRFEGTYCLHIVIYIQQDATLHSLFYPETALHVSGGTSTHNQERKQLYLQHLVFVTPLLLPAAIPIVLNITVLWSFVRELKKISGGE